MCDVVLISPPFRQEQSRKVIIDKSSFFSDVGWALDPQERPPPRDFVFKHVRFTLLMKTIDTHRVESESWEHFKSNVYFTIE